MFSPLFCFEQVKTLKNFSKKLFTSETKKEEAETKSSVWDLKMPNTLANPRTVKRYETGMCIGLFSNRSQKTSKCGKNISDTLNPKPAARSPLLCFQHILTSSLIYYWTDPRQLGIYLLNRAQWKLLYLPYNKESVKSPTRYFLLFSKQTIARWRQLYTLIKHAFSTNQRVRYIWTLL